MGQNGSKEEASNGGGGHHQHRASTGAAPAVSREVQTVQALRDQVTQLGRRQDMLQKRMDAELEQAKAKLKAGNKPAAQAHLKKKKLYEKEYNNLSNMIEKLETQAITLESTVTTASVVQTMRQGAETQKTQQSRLDVDDIRDLQDNIADMQKDLDDVHQVFVESTDPLADEEVANELQELMLDETPAPLKAAPAAAAAAPAAKAAVPRSDISLPAAPTHPVKISVPVPADDDDAALRALEAEMS